MDNRLMRVVFLYLVTIHTSYIIVDMSCFQSTANVVLGTLHKYQNISKIDKTKWQIDEYIHWKALKEFLYCTNCIMSESFGKKTYIIWKTLSSIKWERWIFYFNSIKFWKSCSIYSSRNPYEFLTQALSKQDNDVRQMLKPVSNASWMWACPWAIPVALEWLGDFIWDPTGPGGGGYSQWKYKNLNLT
jgi:hypothetical protein